MIRKEILTNLYCDEKLSMKQIAVRLNCSVNKVSYWMKQNKISRRTISESVYLKHNPLGDPFIFARPVIHQKNFLFGLGLGLYWGEGTKANKYSIRLGNTDPKLIMCFIVFLETFFKISRKDMKFGIQVFSTMSPSTSINFWAKELDVSKKNFMKVVVTEKRGEGTYHKKIEHGVLTVYYNNKKARDILIQEIENIKKIR
jgi:hypothetical protein